MNNKKFFRIVLFTTSDLSIEIIKILLSHNYNIIAIVGKKNISKKNKNYCNLIKFVKDSNILFLEPSFIEHNNQLETLLINNNIDIIIVFFYGYILNTKILNIPKFGCINIHFSLLPKWKGSSPVQRSIQYGDSITGVSILMIDEFIDSGKILISKSIPICMNDNCYTLTIKILVLAKQVLLEVLENFFYFKKHAISQQGYSSYAKKINKKEGKINFEFNLYQIDRHIRAFYIWPQAYFILNNLNVKVGKYDLHQDIYRGCVSHIVDISNKGFMIQANDGLISFQYLQFPNKKLLHIKDIINGNNIKKYIGSKV